MAQFIIICVNKGGVTNNHTTRVASSDADVKWIVDRSDPDNYTIYIPIDIFHFSRPKWVEVRKTLIMKHLPCFDPVGREQFTRR
jgi:hypothetical protein